MGLGLSRVELKRVGVVVHIRLSMNAIGMLIGVEVLVGRMVVRCIRAQLRIGAVFGGQLSVGIFGRKRLRVN